MYTGFGDVMELASRGITAVWDVLASRSNKLTKKGLTAPTVTFSWRRPLAEADLCFCAVVLCQSQDA